MVRYSVYSKVITVEDTAKAVEPVDIVLEDCNIHVQDNSIYYGNGDVQNALASVGSVISFKKLNLKYLFVKNETAGNNGKIVVVGTMEVR